MFLLAQEDRKADEKAKASRLKELDKVAKTARKDLISANKARRRYGRTKRYVV
jgi:ribosomal protein S20